MKRIFYLLTITVIWATYATAGSLRTTLDPDVGTEGDTFNLTVTVEGSAENEFALPKIKGIDVLSSGTSTQISWVNGAVSRSVIYTYVLQPSSAGSYTIPALTLIIDGTKEQSAPIAFEVQNGNAPQHHSQNQQAKTEGNTESSDAPVFIKRSVSKVAPYEGEAVLLETKIYHRVELANAQDISEKPTGVRLIDLDQQQMQERVGNHLYDVINVRRVLVPNHTGPIEIPPFKLKAGMIMPSQESRRARDLFSEFFAQANRQVVTRVYSSQAISMAIKAVPAEGRPTTYHGLVGQFTLEGSLSGRTLKVGETSTLTLSIKGRGSLDGINSDDFKINAPVKIYADKPNASEKADPTGIVSRKILKFALVPTKDGILKLGTFTLSYFDPDAGNFKSTETDLGELTVSPSDERPSIVVSGAQQTQNAQQSNVKALNEDLVDLHRDPKIFAEHHALRASDHAILALLALLMPLVYALFYLATWLRTRVQSDDPKRRASQAFKRYKEAKAAMDRSLRHAPDQLLAEHYQAYRRFLGHKLNVHGQALTPKEIDERLTLLGIALPTRNAAQEIAKLVDNLAYSDSKPGTEKSLELSNTIDSIVREVEKRC